MPKATVKRPSKVRILGRDYKIHYVAPSPLSTQYTGLCDNPRQEIFVETCQTPIEEADTVLHEVLHGIRYMTKLDLDSETEEKVVSALATGLLTVIQENPEFAAYLSEVKE